MVHDFFFSNYIFEYRGNSIRRVLPTVFHPSTGKETNWTEYFFMYGTGNLQDIRFRTLQHCLLHISDKQELTDLKPSLNILPNGNLNSSLKFKRIKKEPTSPSLFPNMNTTPNSYINVKNSSQQNTDQWMVNSQMKGC